MSDFIKKLPASHRQFLSINLLLEAPVVKGNQAETGDAPVLKLAGSDRHQTQALSVHPYYKEI